MSIERGANPYVDYYRSAGISPVRQDVSDRERHFARRASLYRALGIPPSAVADARVLEIGPGSGHNALYTASLGPASYDLVDGNPVGLQECRALLEPAYPHVRFAFREALVEQTRLEDRYDLVIAEGLIPCRPDPGAFARTIGAAVRPDGIFVVTTMDAVSFLGEILRRLVGQRIAPRVLPLAERVRILAAAYAPHLATLRGMSRSPEEWVLDNVTHPLEGKLFSIGDAVQALDEDFEFYGSSPDFVVDWRWYKTLTGVAERDANARALAQYRTNVLNLLDHRFTRPPCDPALGERVLANAELLYDASNALEFGEAADFEANAAAIDAIADAVAAAAPESSAALREAAAVLRGRLDLREANAFAPLFGRGMQYVSLIRKT